MYGDPLATVVHIWRWGTAPHRSIWDVVLHESEGIWIYFWGVFGPETIILPDTALEWIGVVTILSGVGLTFWVWNFPDTHTLRDANLFYAWVLSASWGMLVLLALLRWTLIVPASQGRLLYPAIGSFAAMGGAGLYGWRKLLPGKAFSVIVLMTLGGMGVISVFTPWLIVKPAYMPPPHRVVSPHAPRKFACPREVQFGDFVLMRSFTVRSPEGGDVVVSVKNGEKLYVGLELYALGATHKNYSMSLQVVLPYGDKKAAQLDTYPGGGLLPTSDWAVGEQILDSYELPIMFLSDRPLRGTLQMSFYDFENGSHLPWKEIATGEVVKRTPLILAEIRLLPPEPLKVPPEAEISPVDFGGKIRLEGVEWKREPEGVVLRTYWRALRDVHKDYHLFVHETTSPSVPPISSYDHLLGEYLFPSHLWRAGDVVLDETKLPSVMRCGLHCIYIGIYDPGSGIRLTAVRGKKRLPQDSVPIEP